MVPTEPTTIPARAAPTILARWLLGSGSLVSTESEALFRLRLASLSKTITTLEAISCCATTGAATSLMVEVLS